MAKNVYKWNLEIRASIIKLYSECFNICDIANILGISLSTLNYWIKKYELKPIMEQFRNETISSTITRSLLKNANGGENSEITKEYVQEDANGTLIKVTEKIKIDKPCHKSAQILARKFEKELSDSNNNISDTNSISINIDTSRMSLRELQAIDSPLGSVVDAKAVTLGVED